MIYKIFINFLKKMIFYRLSKTPCGLAASWEPWRRLQTDLVEDLRQRSRIVPRHSALLRVGMPLPAHTNA